MKYRIQYKVALYVFKALNGVAPTYITKLVNLYMLTRKSLRLSSMKLVIDSTKSSEDAISGDRSFSDAAAKVWNTLPESVKYANSIDSFMKNLKKFLFKTAY